MPKFTVTITDSETGFDLFAIDAPTIAAAINRVADHFVQEHGREPDQMTAHPNTTAPQRNEANR